jgi:hypothetical protein
LIKTRDTNKIRIGDLNGDRRLDIAGIGWGTDTVTTLLNVRRLRFTPRAYAAKHAGYDDLEVADVTGDAAADIVVMSGQLYADPNITVLKRSAVRTDRSTCSPSGTARSPARRSTRPTTLPSRSTSPT